ncbi:MAG: amidohydrolase [Rhodothermaceae bacterium]|nr:amidohydrolase [Rhodothermaceae bacterium]
MKNKTRALAEDIFPEVVQLRRTIHENPELAFEEYETAQLVQQTLSPLGLDIKTGVAKTGIVATLEGALPGPEVVLRADMDALPIHEANDLAFKSKNDGKMHACGHDVHTSSLLGTAKILSALKEDLRGTVRFLFQPSEERLPGGAKVMIEEGALSAQGEREQPEVIFGQHVQPDLHVGKIGVRNGMYMASADEIYITVHGKGGHAAAPHYLDNDTILTAAHIVVALQTIISRNCPPDVPGVLSIGKFIGDGATNVIPTEVRLEGTLRAMDESFRSKAHSLIQQTVEHTAKAFGARVDLDIKVGYPALFNHDMPTDFVRNTAQSYVGSENVVELDKWFASEDFAYYLRELPGSFYRIGVFSNQLSTQRALHTPHFDVDEDALKLSTGFMAFLAMSYGKN